jgi:hypothetical protein
MRTRSTGDEAVGQFSAMPPHGYVTLDYKTRGLNWQVFTIDHFQFGENAAVLFQIKTLPDCVASRQSAKVIWIAT